MNITFLSETPKRLLAFAGTHKILSALVILVFCGLSWWAYAAISAGTGETRYVLASVERGTIISVVSGSGQVSASREVELSAETSGKLVSVSVKAGQQVPAGAHIASVDLGDSAFELESARLEYEELVALDPDDVETAETNAANAHTDARTTLVEISSDLSDAITAIDDILDGYLGYQLGRSRTEENLIDTAKDSYYDADDAVDLFIEHYRALNSASTNEEITTLVENAHDTTLVLLQAAKDTKDAVAYLRDREDDANVTEANEAYTSINETVASISAAVESLTTARDEMKETNDALAELIDGPDTLDIRSAQLTLSQKQDAYNDHFVTAPFAGTIAKVSAKVGDTVSSGGSIATIITEEQLAEITLNEVDVAKIEIGQKATITFDAIEGLSVSGTVAEIEGVGTVEQGVVSYGVTIAFDTQDERVRPGMSVNADIQTALAQDALVVPASAVKTANGESYVQVFNPAIETNVQDSQGVLSATSPQNVLVETGITDDTQVEIVSGLSEGDQIVVRVTTNSSSRSEAAGATTQQRGGFGGGAILR